MGMTFTMSCDYDGCDVSESVEPNTAGDVIGRDDRGHLISIMPAVVSTSLSWCRYEPEAYPDGRVYCREHERQIREALGIRLRG